MDHLYEIVWADDAIGILLEDNKGIFERSGIRIHPFTNAGDALGFIRDNPKMVDAVITDAKYSAEGESFREEGYSFPGLAMFMRELAGLRKETGAVLPCWVFTGYGDRLREKYDSFELGLFNGVVDKKTSYTNLKAWVEEICRVIEETQSPSSRIRRNNPDLFQLCSEAYLGDNQSHNMLWILGYEEHPDGPPPFNEIRQIMERTFDMLVSHNVLPADTAHSQITARARTLRDMKKTLLLPDFIVDSLILLADSSSLSHSVDPKDITNIDRYEFDQGRAETLFPLLLCALRTALPWIKGWLDDFSAKPAEDIGESASEGNNQRAEGILLQESRWRFKLPDGRLTEPIAPDQVKKYFYNGQRVTADINVLNNGRVVAKSINKVKTKPPQSGKRGK